MNKKVLEINVDDYGGYNGVYSFVVDRIVRMSNNIDFTLIGLQSFSICAQKKLAHYGIKCLSVKTDRNGFLRQFDWYFLVKRIAKKDNFDIAHIHSDMAYKPFILALACKNAGIKHVIVHSHSTGADGSHRMVKFLYHVVFKIFLSQMSLERFACSRPAGEWMFGRDRQFTVLKNAVNIERFRFEQNRHLIIRHRLHIGNNFVIGHSGRFSKVKNHSFLIDIFAEVVKRRPEARLLLLGDGELMNDIKQKVEQLGLTDKVIFAGSISNPEDYYQAMDCFVMPSLFEGLPITGVEAQASGLPCLFSDTITDEVGITDLAEFFPITDASLWADRICNLEESRNREVYAQKVAEAGYDINVEAKKLEKFYLMGKYE